MIIQNVSPSEDLPHIHHPVIYYLMPETATWESTYFLRELWLKWSWPQCKHMSERWLTISHYNSLSTHPGSSNSCPHYSQKVSEIRLSEYSTQSPNKTHRPWASRSGAGEGGGLRFPARRGGLNLGKIWSQPPFNCPDRTWHREALFGETHENIQPPGSTDTPLLSKMVHNTAWQTPDKHTYNTHTQNLLGQRVTIIGE